MMLGLSHCLHYPVACALMALQVQNTVFKGLTDDSVQLDTSTLEELFRASGGASGGATTGAAGAAGAAAMTNKAKGPVLLLDGKRQQNAGIALSRVRLSHSEIRRMILAGDATNLRLENIQRLLDCVPTPEELQTLRDYEGHPSELG